MKYQKTASRMPSFNHTFLQLVRLGIGHSAEQLCEPVDWNAMESLATKQGLLGVVLDGIQSFAENSETIPYKKKLEWLGQVMQGYELRYLDYRKAIDALAAFYNTHGFRMMLLKGYACGRDWPRPEHRPYGDIDIWLFGKQKEADALLESFKFQDSGFKNIKVDRSHHHHTVFDWMGFTVENHYDFVNVYARQSSAVMEKVFKELGQDDSHFVEVNGQKVYLPSPNLHALFLIKHMVSHFAAAEISLRHVLDWAFFVEKHTEEIDWGWLKAMIDKFSMNDFVSCINAICVEDLGFDASLFHGVQLNSQLKDRVLKDIVSPAYGTEEPKGLIKKWTYKYRRWKGNAWKHDMCYGESRRESFWTLLRSHLMKPSV